MPVGDALCGKPERPKIEDEMVAHRSAYEADEQQARQETEPERGKRHPGGIATRHRPSRGSHPSESTPSAPCGIPAEGPFDARRSDRNPRSAFRTART